MLTEQRLCMTMVRDGQKITDRMDQGFVIEGDVLTLTLPDGSVTSYERVK